ncbi:DUF362 domain-containing protein [Haloplanus pelagicus]|uniref:DUF362 domain-containing protein n=1 Tax=Haloplanus pelagicus TaxID=2949995 RepID=UPI00203C7796|nr:DUF362 domain-containing protein [Haloplanus sp. HW8-1]
MIDPPNPDRLAEINDASIGEFPDLVLLERTRDQPQVDDVEAATRAAVDDVLDASALDDGAEVGITAGSRGIHDMPAILAAAVEHLQGNGYEPFVLPAMGSHGGATAQGQRDVLESLGITEASVGCEIRSSMTVETVGRDAAGRPVYAATDALDADAVLLANRVKLHTDFHGDVESGLSKMAVIGLGKQRGADVTHRAGLDEGLDVAIPERAAILFEETPIVGGIAMYENAADRAAHVEGIPVDAIPDREPELLAASEELFPRLPVDDLDLLIVDEIGKNVSGTGMDTNVIGRMNYHGQPEPDTPNYDRIYVRGLTPESHHNAIGMGLADFVHGDVVPEIDLTDTYINGVTGGEPSRSSLPVIAPSDEVALLLAYSSVGRGSPADLRIGYVENTLEPDRIAVSAPVAAEVTDRNDIEAVNEVPLRVHDGDFAFDPFRS